MERIQVEGSILSWELESGAARLEIDASSGPTAPFTSKSAFRLTSLNGRLSIGLALLPTSRVIDISIQPGVMQEVLPSARVQVLPARAVLWPRGGLHAWPNDHQHGDRWTPTRPD